MGTVLVGPVMSLIPLVWCVVSDKDLFSGLLWEVGGEC